MTLYYGIDVSGWNRVFDWAAVRGNGITYASVKTTQGDYYVNPACSGQISGARGAGVVAGAYHFADPNQSVARNVDYFVSRSQPLGVFERGSLLPMLDVEDSPGDGIRWNPWTANTFVPDWIDRFRDRTGVARVSVYANRHQMTELLRPDEWADDNVVLWLALYNGDPGNTGGYGHRRLGLHQHTQTGYVPGVEGNVDRNVTVNGVELPALMIGDDVVVPAPSGPPPAPVPSPGGWVDYAVRSGDTLSGIAAERGTTADELARVNAIRDPNLIYPGQVIRVPASGGGAGGGGGGTIHYRIQPGDSLSALATRYGTTVSAIVGLNGIPDPNVIIAGTWIDIPQGGGGGGDLPAPPQAVRSYTVRSGQFLGGIAAELGVSVSHLVRMNNIANPDLIYPGQTLLY